MIRDQVSEFHRLMGAPVNDTPAVPADERVKLRLRLIAEEFFELLQAHGLDAFGEFHEAQDALDDLIGCFDSDADYVDIVKTADALGDLAYVIEGMNLEYGISSPEVLEEIQRSNMSKAGGVQRDDGKILKGPNYSPPDIAGVLTAQGWDGK